jgi:hypothetical protein
MENQTNMTFDTEEKFPADKGLKYNLYYNKTAWIQTLSLEAETAFSQMHTSDQNCMRYLTAKKIKTYKNIVIHNITKVMKRKRLKKNEK